MSNEFFVAGLILVTLIIGAAVLPVSTLLRPNRKEQVWLGIFVGAGCMLMVAVHHFANPVDESVVYPGIVACAGFLFGPLAGSVAAAIALLGELSLDREHVGNSAAIAVVMWLIGSLAWLGQQRTRINYWIWLLILVGLTMLAMLPLTDFGQLVSSNEWDWLSGVPWQFGFSVVVFAGSVGLLKSRAHTMQMLRLRESELVQALKTSGGGRWEWNVLQQQFSYHGNFFLDFGLHDSPDDEDATPLKPLRTKQAIDLQSRIHPQDLQRQMPTILDARDGRSTSFYAEFRLRDNLGRWRWLIARATAVETDKHGRTLRMSGMLLDISAHRELTDALQLSQTKYATFYKTLPDPAGIVRIHDGCYLDVNPALERLLKLSADQVVGKPAEAFGLKIETAYRARFMHLLRTEGHVQGMPMLIHHDGVPIPGLLSGRRTHVNGESCMVFVFHDMTHAHQVQDSLQASTQLLQQASRLARLGSWEGMPGMGIIYWSDVSCEIHGEPVGTPAPTDYINKYVAPEWRERVYQSSIQSVHPDTPLDTEFEIIRTDGRRVWVRVRSEGVFKDDKLIKLRGILQDIDDMRRASERIQASEARFEHIFQALPLPLSFVRRKDGRIVDVNPAWESALGYSRDESQGHSLVELSIYSQEVREQMVRAARETGQLVGYENEFRIRSGEIRTVLQSMSPIEVGGQACWLISLIDISERKLQERKVREREELLSLTISAAAIGLWDWDLRTGRIRGDPRWHAMQGRMITLDTLSRAERWETGVSNDELGVIENALNHHLSHPDDPFDATWRVSPPQTASRWIRNVGKVVVFGADGSAQRMLGVSMDVTLQREQTELLHHMAHYDALTGLPNRVLFAQRLRESVEQARAQQLHMAVVYIDLDALKSINDQLGHDGGDRLLVQVAGRLQRALRPIDSVARLGGDEFAVLIGSLTDRDSCERRLRSLMDSLSAPYDLNGTRVEITASVGYTLFPEDSADTDTLIRHADQAMYMAKQAGGNKLRAFDSVQETARLSLMEQRARFELAMSNGELSLYLQPKVNMKTGRVIGAEALTRWVHPQNGVMLPGSFLHLLDESELESRFTDWVMDTTLTQIATLKRSGLHMQISINIVADQLRHRGFADWVLSHLARYPEVEPSQLDLEITENAALYDVKHVARELAQLRAIGVSVSLDDFGTGYSSLAYLRRLPIDQLKLDQSYVRGMVDDPADQAIVKGVIGLARSFGYHIVAEGVESTQQGQILVSMGCMIAQGHGISPPMPADQFADWAEKWRAPLAWLESARALPEAVPLV